jgi:hypothetical protein
VLRFLARMTLAVQVPRAEIVADFG